VKVNNSRVIVRSYRNEAITPLCESRMRDFIGSDIPSEIRAIPVSTDVARGIKYVSGNIFRGKRLSSLRFTEKRTGEHEIIVAYPVNISLRVYGSISYK
jgi:hypothetical protein